jgi:hypothetical protein
MTRLPTVLVGTALAVFAFGAVADAAPRPEPSARAADTRVAAKKKKKPAKKKAKGKKKPAAAKKDTAPALAVDMKVVTLGDVTLLDDPTEGAGEVSRVPEGAVLTITRLGKGSVWVRVKDAKGKQGWLRAAEVVPKEFYDAQGGGGGDVAEKPDEGEGDSGGGGGDDEGERATKPDEGGGGDGDGDGERKKKRRSDDDDDGDGAAASVDARASLDGKWRIGVGASLIGLIRAQDFTSSGSGPIANYTININSPGALVFARVARQSGKLEYGAEASFMLTFGNGGLTVGSGAAAESLTWDEQAFDAHLVGGYRVSPGYIVSARLGYRVLTTTVENSAIIQQPSETLAGVGLGAELLAYGWSPKLEVRLALETLIVPTLTQTDGLADGTDASVFPLYLTLGAGYALLPKVQLLAGYSLTYESYSFTGASDRGNEEGGARTDLQHLFFLGAQYAF